MKPVRTAIVGCGKVDQIHASALSTLPESHFVAVCDVDQPRALTRTYPTPSTRFIRAAISASSLSPPPLTSLVAQPS